MNDANRLKLTREICGRMFRVFVLLDKTEDGTNVMGRMRDAQAGIRARNYEANTRTMRHDATFAAVGGQRAETDEADLDAALAKIARLSGDVARILANSPVPHVATAGERQALGLGDGPWCQSCAGTPGPDGAPRREPIRSDLAGPTDVGGRLDVPAYLCAWCYGCVRDWGRPPTPSEVERHHSVGRVPWPADVPKPA